jgi:hypothetical protein
LAYWFGVNPVALTMKRGRIIYEENRKRIEEEEIPTRDASPD